jgi:hypothetical protein
MYKSNTPNTRDYFGAKFWHFCEFKIEWTDFVAFIGRFQKFYLSIHHHFLST